MRTEHIDSQWEQGTLVVVHKNKAYYFRHYGVDGMRLTQVEILDSDEPMTVDGRVVEHIPSRVRQELRDDGFAVVR